MKHDDQDAGLINKWQFVGFKNISSGAIDCFPEGINASIEFKSEQTRSGRNVSARGPCNTASGNFEIGENNRLRFSSMVLTAVACMSVDKTVDIMELEDKYMRALINVEYYEIKDDELRLFMNQNNAMIFKAFQNNAVLNDKSSTDSGFLCPKGPEKSSDDREEGEARRDCEAAPWKDWCYKETAETESDPRFCEKIEGQNLRKSCYYGVASLSRNMDDCFLLPLYKDLCAITVSKTSTNPEVCERLTGKIRAECYMNIGRTTLNPDLCKKASGFYYSGYEMSAICYRDVAGATGDLALCKGLSKEYYKEECVAAASEVLKDPGICEDLSGKYRARCYMNIGSNIQDPEICAKATGYSYYGVEMNDRCLLNIAVKQGDLSFCEKKGLPAYTKDGCLRFFNIKK